jgi:hypothetical protein
MTVMDLESVPPPRPLPASPLAPDVARHASGGAAAPAGAHQRQRELTRQYKQAARPIGVYAIRNAAEPEPLYLGASLDIDGAINRHRFELGLGGHANKPLLQAWRRCGAASLRFAVIASVTPREDPGFDAKAELATLLALWREELAAQGHTVVLLSK